VQLLATVLQAIGMADVGIALYFGIVNDDMWQELYFALAGVVFFSVGRLLQRRA
jgi:hypothetical protein